MRYRYMFLVVVTLFGLSFCWKVRAQTASAPKQNCEPPRPTYQEDPPPYHIRKNLGIAIFDLLVDEKGKVADVKLSQSSGHDDFDRDATKAVRRWKFKPSTCEGRPTPAHIALQIRATMR